jgi:predicted nuclease of predicted toxin-antitoxin system
MRFLADAGISPKTVEFLRSRGHDAVHVRERALQRASDRELVRLAQAEQRVFVTFDLDFGAILALAVADRPSVLNRPKHSRPAH